MITPEDIINRAKRKYDDILRAWLMDESIFPMEFPVGMLSKNLEQRRKEFDMLRQFSKEHREIGYEVIWNTVNTQAFSKQTIPQRIFIANLDSYLALTRKTTEFNQFVANTKKILQKFPDLKNWIYAHPQKVIEYHSHWDNLLLVCDYFIKSPRPNVYIRELPIAVHTKFIESYLVILRDLLDQLLPMDMIDHSKTDFNKRYGLKDKPTPIRVRLLDEQLDWLYRIRIDDISLPLTQLNEFLTQHIKPKHVIVVENLINFLTLPKLPNTIGLFGGGFGIHLLSEIAYFNQIHLVYWGDMDAHGFEILSDLRGIFPHTESVMMDVATFDKYMMYVGVGKPIRSGKFDHLTPSERVVCQKILEHNWRLEQEHISHEDCAICLRKSILSM